MSLRQHPLLSGAGRPAARQAVRRGIVRPSAPVGPTMRAITYDQYGDPDNLTLTDVPEPKVGPAEVLIRVHSAAVNPVDWKVAAGGLDPLMTTVFPAIPGWDVAGVLERVGL